MKIVVILMVMCSTTPGNDCKTIPTSQVEFKDMYECTVYGYSYSHRIITEFDPEWVNSMEVYTKFSCKPNTTI